MKTQTIQLSSQDQELICSIFGKKEDLLFFDIETTGLSPKNASVYLIGTAGWENGNWVMRQWFAEDEAWEEAVLDAFLQYAAPFPMLVHFNGTTFDIPFLQARCKKHGLRSGLANRKQLDVYRQISPWKNILKLPNCRQKTLEEFLGIFREDPFNGGQLIQLYHAYKESRDERLLKVLLLHNADDIRGMLSILPVLAYPALLEGTGYGQTDVSLSGTGHPQCRDPQTCQTSGSASGQSAPGFSIGERSIVSGTDYAGNGQKELLVRLKFSRPLPVAFTCNGQGCFFSAEKGEGMLKIPVFTGELKYFYPDHKNYSYLPEEDRAIHKSVAIYVDKAHRVPATPETCYARKDGEFLPLLGGTKKKGGGNPTGSGRKGDAPGQAEVYGPIFRRSAKEKEGFFLAEETFLMDDGKMRGYVAWVLSCILH